MLISTNTSKGKHISFELLDAAENERREIRSCFPYRKTIWFDIYSMLWKMKEGTFRLFEFHFSTFRLFGLLTFRNSIWSLSTFQLFEILFTYFPTESVCFQPRTWGPGGHYGGTWRHAARWGSTLLTLVCRGKNPVARVERGYPSTSETNPRAQARPLPQVLSWRSQIKIVVILTTFIEIGKSNRCWQQEEPILHLGEDQLFQHMK